MCFSLLPVVGIQWSYRDGSLLTRPLLKISWTLLVDLRPTPGSCLTRQCAVETVMFILAADSFCIGCLEFLYRNFMVSVSVNFMLSVLSWFV